MIRTLYNRLGKISLKFIVMLVPIVSACTLIFLGIFVYLKYAQLNKALDTKIELIANMHALAVAEPLWMLNYESMYRNMGTISAHPEVLCVEVVDRFKNKTHGWSLRDCTHDDTIHIFRTDLQFKDENVGELVLHYTDDSIVTAMLQEIEIGALLFFLLVIATIITALAALRLIIGVPLRHLMHSIQITEKQDKLALVHWSSNDELGQVITAYNNMIREIDQRERDLKNAREQAEEANHTKSLFLANMSHELRNPLNAIIGFSRIVMRRCERELPPKQYANMGKIVSSAEHLLALINNILDLSKIEAGRMDVHRKAFDLELLIDTCLHTMEPLIKTKGLRLVAHIAPDLPPLYSDEEKIRQILLNLLSNAAKFTKQGSITVRASHRDECVVIAVEDTGIGIAPDQQEAIFDEFTQLDSGSTKEYGGTGLGLSICRHLAELLNGRVSASSEIGCGSVFTLTIPLQHNAMVADNQSPTIAYEDSLDR